MPASFPQPLSYQAILGIQIDTLLSNLGLTSIKVGGGALSILEASASADVRVSEDIFTLLDNIALEFAEGQTLDNIGNDEQVFRFNEAPATSTVNIFDTSFSKISDKIFQGTAAPIVGSLAVNVTDASAFPSSGQIYLGRGSANIEGPLSYTGKLAPGIGGGFSGGSYWTLTLSTSTQRYHNVGETVILAQGGNRNIPTGTVVQTVQGNSANAVQFKVLYSATLPDGEVEVDGIPVVALKPGLVGNVGVGAINSFSGAPFTNAAVTNPNPVSNGIPQESDDDFRERIRSARATRPKGTELAIITNAVGITAIDENKRVFSASVIDSIGEPTTLYLDDGLGYEEISVGVPIESFTDSALGGEDRFQVSRPRPIAKAYIQSSTVAPFALTAGMQLGINVGGTTTIHTFSDDGTFRNINNADAYETVASINADANLNWAARVIGGGTSFAVYGKSDTNENLILDQSQVTNDANLILQLPVTPANTMWLYKNDRLLSKDGLTATIVSNQIGTWIGGGNALTLAVDGTPAVTYTFSGADFVAANTGFTTLGINTVQAWAQVLQFKIPGITATTLNGSIVLSSNLNLNARSSLVITAGSFGDMVSTGMFNATSVQGRNADYKLDRNTGEVKVLAPLATGDSLTAGTVNTRAFIQSPALTTVSVGTTANWWFAIDAQASPVSTAWSASIPIDITTTTESWGKRERFTQHTGSGAFSNLQEGDWAIFWDPLWPTDIKGQAFRVSLASSNYFEIDRGSSVTTASALTLSSGGLQFARTPGQLEKITATSASAYTASSIVASMDTQLSGADATVYRTTAFRVNTASFGLDGDIALVGADTAAQLFGLPVSPFISNYLGHLASIESGNSENGTPDFHQTWSLATTNDPLSIDWSSDETTFAAPTIDYQLVGLMPEQDDDAGTTRYGNINGAAYKLLNMPTPTSPYSINRRAQVYENTKNDRYYFASPWHLNYNDTLGVLIDGNVETHRYIIPMARTLKTVGTYGSTNTYKDADNGNQSLAVGFGFGGTGYDFNDYALYMAARNKTHDIGDTSAVAGGTVTDTSRTVLWRYYRLGGDGNWATVQYVAPSEPSLPVSVSVNPLLNDYSNIYISLASGALKTGYVLPNTYPVGTVAPSVTSGITTVWYILGFPVVSFQRVSNLCTLRVSLPSGVLHTGLDLSGNTGYYFTSSIGGFPTQNVYPTAEATSGGGIYDELTFTVVGPDITLTTNPGSLSLQHDSSATLAGASPAIAVGDFIKVESTTGVPTAYTGFTGRIVNNIVTNPYQIEMMVPGFTGGTSTTIAYSVLGDNTGFKIFANPAQTVATIVAAVNAIPNTPITGTLIGTGAGVMDRSTYEDAGSLTSYKVLLDGINWVNTTTVPGLISGDYQMSFKMPTASALATNNDWANEVVKAVPRTAKNVNDWLNAGAVSGLFTATDIERSKAGKKIQIASLTPGSLGSVQVQGGTANQATGTIIGPSVVGSTNRLIATISNLDAKGFGSEDWVSVDNQQVLPKNVITSATVLSSITEPALNQFTVTISGSNWYTQIGTEISSTYVSVEQQGKFWCIQDTGFSTTLDLSTAKEGDWIRITPGSILDLAGLSPLDNGNAGIFRIVRKLETPDGSAPFSYRAFWIENPTGVAQSITSMTITLFTADSTMPGDTLHINIPLWDGPAGSNQGIYQITDVGNNGIDSFQLPHQITLSPGPINLVATPTAALGANYQQVQVFEGKPTRLIKQILTISPNQSNSNYSDVKLTTSNRSVAVGAAAGSVITALDKLSFPSGIFYGIDGYRHNTGLIAATNKVIQGDLTDPLTYPGVAAAGSSVNIAGARIRRIQVTVSLRVKTGASKADIKERAQSAVAALINSTQVGQAISMSDITKVAGRVVGVVSATMVSPTQTAVNDLIKVQPFEKPRVLNVANDVLIVFAGE